MKNAEFNNKHYFSSLVNRLLAHASMLLSVLVLVCFVIDRVNDAMDFMTSDLSKWLFAITAVVSILNALFTIINLWVKPENQK